MKMKNYQSIILLLFFALIYIHKSSVQSDVSLKSPSLSGEDIMISVIVYAISKDDDTTIILNGGEIKFNDLVEKINHGINQENISKIVFKIYSSNHLPLWKIQDVRNELMKIKSPMQFVYYSL